MHYLCWVAWQEWDELPESERGRSGNAESLLEATPNDWGGLWPSVRPILHNAWGLNTRLSLLLKRGNVFSTLDETLRDTLKKAKVKRKNWYSCV